MIHDIDRDDDDWGEDYEPEDALFDDEQEEGRASTAPPPSLRQMERDGLAATEEVERLLAEDPDTPTHVLLAAVKKHVRPMSEYRPTDEEMLALRTADIFHTLRGEKEREESGQDNTDNEDHAAESTNHRRKGT